MERFDKSSPISLSEKHNLPITPPATVEKHRGNVDNDRSNIKDIKPRKLFPGRTVARKPKLKYRPEIATVFNIDEYTEGVYNKNDQKNADFIRYALRYSKRTVAVIGAGVSVAAGIPDFRSSEGLFTLLKGKNCTSGKDLFDYNKVYSSDEMNVAFNSMITKLHNLANNSNPTCFHELLRRLALEGRLQRLYTQNIDGLDTRLDGLSTSVPLEKPIPQTIQLHGSINHMFCNKCAKVEKLDPSAFNCDLQAEYGANVVPNCQQCEEFESVRSIAGLRLKGIGRMRPRVVLYNEIHPEGDIIGEITSFDLRKKPDLLIIAGTSLQIPGVKNICRSFAQKVKSSKGIVLYLNKEMPTQSIIDSIGCIDLIVLGDCQSVPNIYNNHVRVL